MILQKNTPADRIELCLRWQKAMAANDLLGWRALSHLMSAESRIHAADGYHAAADEFSTLSDLAGRHALDLQPVRDEVAA